jgi:aminopeptidase N
MIRSRQVHKVAYQVWLAMNAESPEFQGRTKLVFDVREGAFQKTNKLRVDFTGAKITAVLVNGTAWTPEKIGQRYNGEWLELEQGEIEKGQNKVEVSYSHLYSESGNGLYRFQDPEDKRVYVRSDNEPYYANLILPCFDQPDLKATFEVTVEAPTDWTIVANMPMRAKTKVDGHLSWQFAPSPLMSTYLFAVAAGPWKEWKSDHEGLPLALYARQSLAKHVDAAEWFRITKKGIGFYADFFGVPYPYAKYDQILIPDMNAGAMENIGAVTFSESFVFRGPATEEEKRDRADTILHEMAHMWFGNLVTMRWWNGLWLNESFATYLASVATERTKVFPGAPQAFFAAMKRWAYGEDQLPTTHPIEVSVADTDQATANFDGITYGKGAAALKQFHFLLGDEDFQEGLHRYFTKFANRNTSLADFMAAMGQSSNRPLAQWTKTWLQSTGYGTIAVDLACANDAKGVNRVTKLDLTQKAPGRGNILRPHHFLVGLYYKDAGGRLVRHDQGLQVAFEAERVSLEPALGKKCPDLVFPNEQDYGYFSVELDPKSLETAKTSLAKISDPFTRHLLAFALREMVKAGTWQMDAFANAALEWLKTETNKTLLEDLSEMLASQKVHALSAIRILEGEKRAAFETTLHALARRKAETAAPGSDLQRIWFQLALRSLHDEASADWAMKIYGKSAKISGLKLDLDLRWDILASAARVKAIEAATLEAAKNEDVSSEGQTRALQVKTASADPAVAAEVVPLFTLEKSDPTLTNAKLRKGMSTFLSTRNPARTEAWRPKFFAALETVGAKADESYSTSFARSLFPSLCRAEIADEARDWVESHPKSPRSLRIAVEKMAFAEGWCAAIRAGQPYPLWKDAGISVDRRLGAR